MTGRGQITAIDGAGRRSPRAACENGAPREDLSGALLRQLNGADRASDVVDGHAADHPLRAVLGDLATQRSARRMTMPPGCRRTTRWIWKHNPSGMLSDWTLEVSCANA